MNSRSVKWNWSGIAFALGCCALLAILSGMSAATVSAQLATPNISCLNLNADEAAGTVTFDVVVDSGTDLIDQVRMEMDFDDTVLSNGAIVAGSDFDSDFGKGFQGNLGVAIFGRSEGLGPTSGQLNFASITFDWTGDPISDISFRNGGTGGAESGSLQYLVGDFTPLNGDSCITTDEGISVFDVIAASPNHNDLEAALVATGLDATLDDLGTQFTVFAPDDTLLAQYADVIAGLTTAELTDILLTHVLPGVVDSTAAMAADGTAVTTAGPNQITPTVTDDGLTVQGIVVPTDSALVIDTDLAADNGLVHIVSVIPDDPVTEGTISCLNIIADADAGTVSFDVIVNSPVLLDQVRMEMNFDTAELSNGAIAVGSDFDSDFGKGIQGNLGVGVFGRSEGLGPTSGELNFATVTFDWSGNPTQISFLTGQAATSESGSLRYLVGDFANLEGLTCDIPPEGATPVTPTETPVTPTATPIPTEPSTTPEGTISCLNIIADAAASTVSFDVIVNSPELLDQVRMEMNFDTAELSNGAIAVGSDFDSDFGKGFQGNLGVGVFGRSDGLGPTSGELNFATITFDWSGNPTQISFLTGQAPASESGSLRYLVGDFENLEGLTCDIPPEGSTPVTPTETPVTPTPTTPTPVTPTETPVTPTETPIPTEPSTVLEGTISCLNIIADAAAGTVSFDVIVDSPALLDQVRMELNVPAELSNGVISVGSDFDNDFGKGFQGDLGVAIFGRSEGLGPTSGQLTFANVTFDWTGAATQVTFNDGQTPTEAGSLRYLVGAYNSLEGIACVTATATATPDTPTPTPDTPTPTPDTPTPTPDTPTPTPDTPTPTPDTPTPTPDTPTPTPDTPTPTLIPGDAVIGDYVWDDTANPDGIQGSDEPGIGGVTVNLYMAEDGDIPTARSGALLPPVQTTTTADDGSYSFTIPGTDLPASYVVVFVVPEDMDMKFTLRDVGVDATDNDANELGVVAPLPVASDDNNLNIDAGLVMIIGEGDISGRVTNSEDSAESDVDVNLLNDAGDIVQTTTTDPDGNYAFVIAPDDVNQNYTVEFVVDPTDGIETDIVSGVIATSELPTGEISGMTDDIFVESGDAESADAVIGRVGADSEPQPAVVSGTVTEYNDMDVLIGPKTGIEVRLIGEGLNSLTTTDADGNYLFDVPVSAVGQSYILSYLIPGAEMNGTVLPVSLTEGIRDDSVDETNATTGTSASFTLLSGGEFINDVAYKLPEPLPTAVGLSNTTTLESGSMIAFMVVVLLTTAGVALKTRRS